MKKDKKKKKKQKNTFREYYEAIIVAVLFAAFVKVFIFQTYKIPTESMVKTLLVGDHLIVNKLCYRNPGPAPFRYLMPTEKIHWGDIIVFKYPEDPRMMFVKRVIGVPGDVIQVVAKKTYRNGELLEEPFAVHSDPGEIFQRDYFGPIKVPEGAYFVMGDNRDHSLDSRFWGFVPKDHIMGKPWLIYWSYEAPRYNPNKPLYRKVGDFISVFFHFFNRTRWERTFIWVR